MTMWTFEPNGGQASALGPAPPDGTDAAAGSVPVVPPGWNVPADVEPHAAAKAPVAASMAQPNPRLRNRQRPRRMRRPPRHRPSSWPCHRPSSRRIVQMTVKPGGGVRKDDEEGIGPQMLVGQVPLLAASFSHT